MSQVKDYVRDLLPFLPTGSTIDDKIDRFKIKYYYELQAPFKIADEDVEDDSAYTVPKKSLIADLVAISLLRTRALENSEGDGSGSEGGAGGRAVKRAKAGEAEVEFEASKASDGSRLLLNGNDTIQGLKKDASRKARTLGFILDISEEGLLSIQSFMGKAQPTIANIDYDNCR